jgi:hypothetical protein
LGHQHFGVRLGEGCSAAASLFSNEGEAGFERMLSSEKSHVSGDLGEGTFSFEGTQAVQYPELTMWRFRIYGGGTLAAIRISMGHPRSPSRLLVVWR